MSKHTERFSVTVTSPHGKQAIESFRHWLGKVADEAKKRWGIEITIEKRAEDTEHNTEFND